MGRNIMPKLLESSATSYIGSFKNMSHLTTQASNKCVKGHEHKPLWTYH